MLSSNQMHSNAFNFPKRARYVACCDLDETYIPFSVKNKQLGGIHELESFMRKTGIKKGIVIGWITGTNLESALRKSSGYITNSPHFICCSLGTEFYWVKKRKIIPSKKWKQQITASGYDIHHVNNIAQTIKNHDINLIKQPDDYQGEYKVSFYYKDSFNREHDFAFISHIAQQYNIKTMFTKCNPAAGDLDGYFDIEFIPHCCGKDEAISFIQKYLNLNKSQVYAFGDSFNDFPMLHRAGHGYLVSNADPVALNHFKNKLEHPYCKGIAETLKELK